ncbi:MAG: addiction module toxin RelE [Oscillospiraceae bacterium]|nr:addiction module toxin RelE [Oscillospiraceae bacterium]
MATQKRKPLTKREKELNARIKKELQAEGRIPPDKPRLNRKKFAEEVRAEWDATEDPLFVYLMRGVSVMIGPSFKGYSLENIGVLKALKIAMETKKFEASLPEGTEKYSPMDYYEKVVKPIIDL